MHFAKTLYFIIIMNTSSKIVYNLLLSESSIHRSPKKLYVDLTTASVGNMGERKRKHLK